MTPIKMTLREIDAAVAERVMGWKPMCRHEAVTVLRGSLVQCDRCWEKFGATTLAMARAAADPPRYSTDIAAAWEVLEKCGQMSWAITITPGEPVRVEFGGYLRGVVDADTAPLAICLAALRSRGLDVEVIT